MHVSRLALTQHALYLAFAGIEFGTNRCTSNLSEVPPLLTQWVGISARSLAAGMDDHLVKSDHSNGLAIGVTRLVIAVLAREVQ